MEDAVARLRSYAQTEGLDAGPADRLAATVAQQEELTERFKSSNALLQNSLSYVGLLSTSPAFGAQDAQLAPATGALAAAILYLTRDTSPDAVKALQERIDRFAAQAPTVGPDAEAARALLAHARLLHDLLPAVDETLKALIAVPSQAALKRSAHVSNHQRAVEATAQRFRLLLYLVSLLLLVMLVYLGLRLRARALALTTAGGIRARHSRELDTPDQLPAGRNGCAAEASAGGSAGRSTWNALMWCSMRTPPECIHGARTERPIRRAGPIRRWHCPRGSARPDRTSSPCRMSPPCRPAHVKDTLAAAGVRGWACVPLIRPGRVRGIMGFDAFAAGIGTGFSRCPWCGSPATRWQMHRARVSRARSGELTRGWNGRAACRWSDRWQAG